MDAYAPSILNAEVKEYLASYVDPLQKWLREVRDEKSYLSIHSSPLSHRSHAISKEILPSALFDQFRKKGEKN